MNIQKKPKRKFQKPQKKMWEKDPERNLIKKVIKKKK